MRTKVMSLRISQEAAAELGAIARAEGVSSSEAIRAAIYRYISERKGDEDLHRRLQEKLAEDQKTLERLMD